MGILNTKKASKKFRDPIQGPREPPQDAWVHHICAIFRRDASLKK